MNNYITKHSEARDEAERLSHTLKRDVEAVAVPCSCDYSKACYCCAGSGTYYEPRYAFCDHAVQDGDDLECDANDCARLEHEAAMVERVDTFPRVGVALKSCQDLAIEEREADAA